MSAIRTAIIASLGEAANATFNLVGNEGWTLPNYWPGDNTGRNKIFPDDLTAGRQIYRALYTAVSFITLGSAFGAYSHSSSISMGDTNMMNADGSSSSVLYNACLFSSALGLGAAIASLFNASPLGLMPSFEGGASDDNAIAGVRRDDTLKFTTRGLTRITRHPLILPVVPWGFATAYLAGGRTCDYNFFGGISIYAMVGCFAQDLRVIREEGSVGTVFQTESREKIEGDEEERNQLRLFFEETSFIPFKAAVDGRQSLDDIAREFPWVQFVIGSILGVFIEEKILQLIEDLSMQACTPITQKVMKRILRCHFYTRRLKNSGADATNEASEAGTTMELNLRLDGDGRTTYDPALRPPPTDSVASSTPTNDPEQSSKRAKIDRTSTDLTGPASLDYSSKTTLTDLASPPRDSSMEKAMNDLLFDCEIADSGLLPRTFWVPATATEPRCCLEKLALDVFHHHVPSNENSNHGNNNNNFYYDPATSGAEWWVQLRPSPPAGRFAMLDADVGMAKSGVSFHWDKDEDLRLMCGGSMYIHPHISTVTYLTDLGAPTMVLTKRVDAMTGQYVQETNDVDGSADPVEGFVSWPKRGKHLSFDGRYLHAAPSDLMEDGLFEKQCSFDISSEMDEKTKKILARKHRRVTFLVNVCLNYRPFNVNPFPETMIGNLSKVDLFGDLTLFGRASSESESKCEQNESNKISNGHRSVVINDGKAVTVALDGNESKTHSADDDVKLAQKTWSMGQKDEETLQVPIPVELIQQDGKNGSDIAIIWNEGVKLGGTGA